MNTKTIQYLVVAFIVLLYSIPTEAQFYFGNNDLYSYSHAPQNLAVSSPQSSAFIQYGNVGVNKYNGLLDLNIDLGGYQDNDFDIPITLRYISNGFRPQYRPSMVGNNWMLECGGLITRTVKGTPDEICGYYTNDTSEINKYLLAGLYYAAKTPGYWGTNYYSNSDLLNLNIDKYDKGKNNPYQYGDLKHDMEPDIFHYSFGNYSGSFIIQNKSADVILLNDNGCKVDLSMFVSHSPDIVPTLSEIKITTPDGYVYSFGGGSSYLESVIPCLPSSRDYKEMPAHIKSWYLKSIEAPNERKATFKYKSLAISNSYIYAVVADYKTTSAIVINGAVIPVYNVKTESQKYEIYDRICLPVIEEIVIDETVIKFTTNRKEGSFYSTLFVDCFTEPDADYNIYLKSIDWYYNNEKIKNSSFSYLKSGSYFYLETLNNNSEVYNFTYNLNYRHPFPFTNSSDRWGYWNGEYVYARNPTEIFPNIIGPGLRIFDKSKDVSQEYFDATLLNKITYPTGGWTEIFYELNKYNYYIDRSDIKQVDNGEFTVCGGARVKMQRDFDPLSGKYYNEKEYLYKKSIDGSDYGILCSHPFIYKAENEIPVEKGEPEVTAVTYSYTNLPYEHIFGEYHIAYPSVIELYKDNSYKHSTYTSWFDIPDKDETKFKYYKNGNITTITESNTKTGLYITNDLSAYRGKLLTEEIYDSNHQLKRRTKNTYNYTDGENINIKNVSVISHPRGMAAYCLYDRACNLLAQEITDENGITVKRRYSYLNKNLLIEIVDYTEEKLTYKKEFLYSFNFPNSDFFKQMIDKNIINTLVFERSEKFDYTNQDKSKYNARSQYIQYEQLSHKLFKPFKVLAIYSDPKDKGQLVEAYVDNEGRIMYPGFEVQKTFEYDTRGNIINIVGKDLRNCFYLWSYDSQYPIAQVENVSYDELNSALSSLGISIDDLAKSLTPDMDKINLLRNHENMKNAFITTFTYKPLVGMTSTTDARGITTYYSYDNKNKLSEVYIMENGQKQILETYEYHYGNQ